MEAGAGPGYNDDCHYTLNYAACTTTSATTTRTAATGAALRNELASKQLIAHRFHLYVLDMPIMVAPLAVHASVAPSVTN